MQEAVSGRGFAHAFSQLDDFAVCQHYGHSHYIVSGHSVFYCSHSSRVCADVSSNCCSFLTRIRRVHQPVCECISRKITEQHARLDMNTEIVHIVFEDAVHFFSRNYDSTIHRYTAAHKSCSGSPNCSGDLCFIAHLQDSRYFFCRLNQAQRIRHMFAIDRHFIMPVVLFDSAIGKKTLLPDNRFQLVSQFRRQFVVCLHVVPPS